MHEINLLLTFTTYLHEPVCRCLVEKLTDLHSFATNIAPEKFAQNQNMFVMY